MSIRILVVFAAAAAILAVAAVNAIPIGGSSWHKISKRDTAAAAGSADKTTSAVEANKGGEKDGKNNADSKNDQQQEADAELIDPDEESFAAASADPSATEPEQPSVVEESDSYPADRSIDWQLLSGNPEDLQQELETRRRRRSVRSAAPSPSSLARQHRIRMTAGRSSRAKRNAYDGYGGGYDGDEDRTTALDPADLLAAYEYLQARRQEELLRDQQYQQQQQQAPQISLLDPNGGGDIDNADLVNLAYELQQEEDQRSDPVDLEDIQEDQQQQLPYEYLQQQQPQILVTPDQLAALELALSEPQQQRNDGDEDYYPKDKRSRIDYSPPSYDQQGNEQDDDDDGEDEQEQAIYEPRAIYLIPAGALGGPAAAAEDIVVPSYAAAGGDPSAYNFYQIDDGSDNDGDSVEQPRLSYEDVARLYQEEQLRRRIASLVDEINEQRRIDNRRR